ncbi:MAG: pyruvate kinase [Patescibacteria group bacterium]|jgi:pyruvate kinase
MQIIATISQKSYAPEKIEEILRAGASVLRFNMSHGTPEESLGKMQVARDVIKKLGSDARILADLPGNKLRLGDFPELYYEVQACQRVVFKTAQGTEDPAVYLPVNVPDIATYVRESQEVTIGDGEVGFRVLQIQDKETFIAEAINSGKIGRMKGFNIGSGMDALMHITEKTLACMDVLPAIQPDWVAVSFANSGDYMRRTKALLAERFGRGKVPPVVSKVETPKGVAQIDDIAAESDIVMVARGDLAVTAPVELLGVYQKRIVQAAKKAGKPVIVSTQILESLLTNYMPSRSDVLDLTNIVLDGAEYIMLAKETGVSDTPGHSVTVAKQIIDAVEHAAHKAQ